MKLSLESLIQTAKKNPWKTGLITTLLGVIGFSAWQITSSETSAWNELSEWEKPREKVTITWAKDASELFERSFEPTADSLKNPLASPKEIELIKIPPSLEELFRSAGEVTEEHRFATQEWWEQANLDSLALNIAQALKFLQRFESWINEMRLIDPSNMTSHQLSQLDEHFRLRVWHPNSYHFMCSNIQSLVEHYKEVAQNQPRDGAKTSSSELEKLFSQIEDRYFTPADRSRKSSPFSEKVRAYYNYYHDTIFDLRIKHYAPQKDEK